MSASTIPYASIAAAIATVFNVTAPSGYPEIVYSTHLLPDKIVDSPVVLVFPPAPAEFVNENGSRRTTLDWTVRLFYGFGADLPTRMGGLYAWFQQMGALLPLSTNVDLGLGSVVRWSAITRGGITTAVYGTEIVDGSPRPIEWPVIEFTVQTHVGEPLS